MSNNKKPLTEAVKEISSIPFRGNIIPHPWYKNITVKKANKHNPDSPRKYPHLLAINLLADICYWYRYTEIRDEQTGATLRYERKFADDKLQRSYRQIADFFGCSYEQAREAVKFLESANLITTEFRQKKLEAGTLNKVMYIEPVAKTVKMVSAFDTDAISSIDEHPSSIDKHPSSIDEVVPGQLTRDTYTSSESSSKTSSSSLTKETDYTKPDTPAIIENIDDRVAFLTKELSEQIDLSWFKFRPDAMTMQKIAKDKMKEGAFRDNKYKAFPIDQLEKKLVDCKNYYTNPDTHHRNFDKYGKLIPAKELYGRWLARYWGEHIEPVEFVPNQADLEKELKEEIIPHYNELMGTEIQGPRGISLSNYAFWREVFSTDKIRRAIDQIPSKDFWKNDMSLNMLFNRKNKNGECNYIQDLLNIASGKGRGKPNSKNGRFGNTSRFEGTGIQL